MKIKKKALFFHLMETKIFYRRCKSDQFSDIRLLLVGTENCLNTKKSKNFIYTDSTSRVADKRVMGN